MKATLKAARQEIRTLGEAKGLGNITGGDLLMIMERTGCTSLEASRALWFWTLREEREAA